MMRAQDDRLSVAIRRCWWGLLLLSPFLARGVVGGDEGSVLRWARAFWSFDGSLVQFIRQPDYAYAYHHLLWFLWVLVCERVTHLLTSSLVVADALLSWPTVLAGIVGVGACYRLALLRHGLSPARGLLLILAIFIGGYGCYAVVGAGAVESYMLMIVALRQTIDGREGAPSRSQAVAVAVLDALLVMLKPYAIIYVVITAPLTLRGRPRPWLVSYGGVLAMLLLVFAIAKVMLWSPPRFYAVAGQVDALTYLWRIAAQFFSPSTGLLLCMPVVLVLAACPAAERRHLWLKLAGMVGLMAFFAAFPFFDGSVLGGRYIFPFLLYLLPELAGGTRALLTRAPALAWTVPALVLVFLPVSDYRSQIIGQNTERLPGACETNTHPVVLAWWTMAAQFGLSDRLDPCIEGRHVLVDPHHVPPQTSLGRIAYVIDGGVVRPKLVASRDWLHVRMERWGLAHSTPFWVARAMLAALIVLISLLAARRAVRE